VFKVLDFLTVLIGFLPRGRKAKIVSFSAEKNVDDPYCTSRTYEVVGPRPYVQGSPAAGP